MKTINHVWCRLIVVWLAMTCAYQVSGQTMPYKDASLSPRERALDLCSRLTLEEKTQLMMDISEPIDRLAVPRFIWWSEALHGVGRNGKCTVFPSCIGMAASFNEPLVERIFTAVSDEARAKNTAQRKLGNIFRCQGLSFWTPNINIFRDPRWGRGQETYGEDPYMNAHMGAAVVRGLQGPTDHKYRKLFACAKHFAVHSGPESLRHQLNIEDLSPRDLWESYLPAFKELVVGAGVKEVMCAYQRFEGDPCCGSERLLQQILRNDWGFKGIVVSDCGAVGDFFIKDRHGVSEDASSAVIKAVTSGTDLECGFNYRNLPQTIREGKLTEEQVDKSVLRLLEGRFELGDFDADSLVDWTNIPESVVACDEHKAMALEMARESMVLLKNNGVLPLEKDANDIVVLGPNANDSVMLWGIYYGQPTHSVTILEGINDKLGQGVRYAQGCSITSMTQSESIFDRFVNEEGQRGMTARFWNNTRMEGTPACVRTFTSPLIFDNGGDTVFAPGVNLTDFTAQFKGSFTAERDEVLDLIIFHDDGLRLVVNGDTLVNKWRQRELVFDNQTLVIEAGKRYDIELNYMQLVDEAILNFDIVRNIALSEDEVLGYVNDASTVIFVGGITPELEKEEAKLEVPGFEGGDRTTIELPTVQRHLLKKLHDVGKKVVFVNCSGGPMALTPESESCDAILQAWYPGEMGGHAVADVLFGDYSPSGKLPVTFYADDGQLPPFEDYSMKGRTYRYFEGEPLYAFGYGLSYTTFTLGKPTYDATTRQVSIDVSNTGDRDGAEVVQVYLRRDDDPEGPRKTLRGFARVELKAGEGKNVVIDMPSATFEWWDKATNTMCELEGEYEMMVGTSSLEKDLQTIKVRNF